MTHLTVREWGSVPVCADISRNHSLAFTRSQANVLLAAARAHPLAKQHGTNILIDRHTEITAAQMVGVIAGPGCSLEILPKIHPEAYESDVVARRRLVQMLDVAVGLQIGEGQVVSMARQTETLLDILIRLFADRLLAETRCGLPRAYQEQENDLPMLRGQLNVRRQYTTLAVRSDRIACRYDALSADTALLRIMKACVALLHRHARSAETSRRLDTLRVLFADVSDVSLTALPWSEVRIDRTNRRWGSLYELARLFLKQEWQSTHRNIHAQHGVTLLFPMNDLFEAYIAVLAKRALRGTELTVHSQSGGAFCLREQDEAGRQFFRTRPDLLIKHGRNTRMVIDTKWKRIGQNLDDPKRGVSQADVYQLMAYARLYRSPEVMLLYPHHSGLGAETMNVAYEILEGGERFRVASVDLMSDHASVVKKLSGLILAAGCPTGRTNGPGSSRAARRRHDRYRPGTYQR